METRFSPLRVEYFKLQRSINKLIAHYQQLNCEKSQAERTEELQDLESIAAIRTEFYKVMHRIVLRENDPVHNGHMVAALINSAIMAIDKLGVTINDNYCVSWESAVDELFCYSVACTKFIYKQDVSENVDYILYCIDHMFNNRGMALVCEYRDISNRAIVILYLVALADLLEMVLTDSRLIYFSEQGISQDINDSLNSLLSNDLVTLYMASSQEGDEI